MEWEIQNIKKVNAEGVVIITDPKKTLEHLKDWVDTGRVNLCWRWLSMQQPF